MDLAEIVQKHTGVVSGTALCAVNLRPGSGWRLPEGVAIAEPDDCTSVYLLDEEAKVTAEHGVRGSFGALTS